VQVEHSSTTNGIQNLECAVLPPGISNAAIPLEATVNTISPLERNADDNALQIKVLPKLRETHKFMIECINGTI